MFKALLTRWSAVAACALALAGCTVSDTERPELAGPSEFALSFVLTATPDSLSHDGSSQSAVVVKAFGPNGAPQSGVTFRLDMVVNGAPVDYGLLSSKSVTTGSDGRATVMYTSPFPVGGNLDVCQPNVFSQPLPGGCLDIMATPVGSNFTGARSQGVQIHLVPLGVILPPALTPTASFTIAPTSPTASTPVQFDASASCAGPAGASGCPSGGGSIVDYSWDFGDGSTAKGRIASHTYSFAQTYSVTLTVTNDRGIKASSTQAVTMGAGAAPTAAFIFSPTQPVANAPIFFDATLSQPGTGHRIVGFTWNWGDGTDPGTDGPTASHTYTVAKTYRVTLTVKDETNQSGTISQSVTVGP